jgi:3-phosphoshikimate 1-carboxyvinyltransferase
LFAGKIDFLQRKSWRDYFECKRIGEYVKVSLKASEIQGELVSPPSKSYTHRALICASLSNGKSTIIDPPICYDTITTAKLCTLLGAEVIFDKEWGVIGRGEPIIPKKILNCGGSGTTLRLLMAVSSLTHGICAFTGDVSLRKRPIGGLLDALKQLGVKTFTLNGSAFPVFVYSRGLMGGDVKIRGDISSQFISALLLACPKAQNDTQIEVTARLQSGSYIDITIEVLKYFDIEIYNVDHRGFIIPSKQEYKSINYKIPGDYSQAAFLLAAGALAGKIKIHGLNLDSKQGDREIIKILNKMGAYVRTENNTITVERANFEPVIIDASNIPDLVPICTVLATQAKGETRIINAERLRLKESDRLRAVTTELNKMGANIKELPDGLIIKGPTQLKGTRINPHNDHRIAMACAIAALVAEGETKIDNAECVNKSYPNFFRDIKTIGADLT